MVGLPASRPTPAALTIPEASPSTTTGWATDSARTTGRGWSTVYETRGAGQGEFGGRARVGSSNVAMVATLGVGVP